MNSSSILNEWILNRKISPDKRMAMAAIHIKYPSVKTMAKLKIAERRKFRNDFLKMNFKKLLNKKYFDTYELVGTKRVPWGVKAKVSLASLSKIVRLSFIDRVFIFQLDGAKLKPSKPNDKFFCIKMTVVIQVEGVTSGMQTCEDRYVLIKARTFQSAYKKVKKHKKDYEHTYLNSGLRLVSWKIESYDDCYETDIINVTDLYSPEVVEVFSKLRRRKLPQR